MKLAIWAFSAGMAAFVLAPGASARQWERVSEGWHVDIKDVKTELKDGVVNAENTMVFQLHQDASDKKPAANAEPTSQLYLLCESRQYRLWDVKTSSEIGPLSNAMFDVAQTLEGYCSRIGKLPEEQKLPRGQR